MNAQNLSRWPLAGREDELAGFGRSWGEPRCRAVVVSGPAGVGKSRLAEECLSRVAGEGWKAATVTATAVAATVPLGAIGHLIPAQVNLSDPVKGFAAVAGALAGPRRDRRWAILVDDMHLLDAASAVLLRQLLDSRLVRLIGTVRTGEPVGDAVEGLTGGDGTHRIDLAAFSVRQTEQVLQAALRGPVGRRALHELHTACGGNALYLRELVLGALASGTLVSEGEIWELAKGAMSATPKLSELIGRRLAAADPGARLVLELLALCEPLSLADAQAASSLETITRLEAAGLVRVASSRRRTTVALAHPLYGEVLQAGLPTLRRRELLLTQASRTQAHGARRREDALHLATWQLAATGTADPALLSQASILARHAHDYQTVVTLLQALPEDHRTYASCLLHGDALSQLGYWEQADDLLVQAQTHALKEDEQVAAALVRTWNLFWSSARTEHALQANESVLRKITGQAGRHLLLLNEASLRTVSGQPDQGLALLEDLENEAKDAPDINVWAVAAMCKTAGLAFLGRIDEAVAWGEHVYDTHAQIDKQEAGLHPAGQLNPVMVALADAGQLSTAREIAEKTLADLMSADVPQTWVMTVHLRGRTEWLAGDAAAARRWHAEAIAQARAQNLIRPLFIAWAGLAAAAAVLGDLDAAEAALAEMRAYPPMGIFAGEEDLGQAWLHAARGDLARARTVLTDAAGRARETGHVTSEMLLLTDIARLGGAKEVADRLADLAQVCDGAFASARAHLAAALATNEAHQLQDAASELEAIGAYLLAAEAATTAAAAWQQAGNTRRATAATNQAQACAAHCPGARTPLLVTAEAVSPLTKREREIALLAAAGTSSKDIAQALHLSVRTVDNHLQRAYVKLGVSSRRELTETFGTAPTRG
ncbi:LuxR C-terminal-related transcriptional regulator [Streptomyces sp. NPDC096153]|uniref:helix-turn-helix transcriptional regulator n=1 Tax=Streptomyces sp. NPDC096153 TaxID=3155548 RepID=UPI00331656A7